MKKIWGTFHTMVIDQGLTILNSLLRCLVHNQSTVLRKLAASTYTTYTTIYSGDNFLVTARKHNIAGRRFDKVSIAVVSRGDHSIGSSDVLFTSELYCDETKMIGNIVGEMWGSYYKLTDEKGIPTFPLLSIDMETD